ncbi:hypothetical protein D9M72_604220 [compost metagenome]
MPKLQGRWVLSSCSRMIFSQAVLQALVEPGMQKTRVLLAAPAKASDCRVDEPISSQDRWRNSSPKPEITLSSKGVIAAAVDFLCEKPVPPLVRTTWMESSAIQSLRILRIWYRLPELMLRCTQRWPAASTLSLR